MEFRLIFEGFLPSGNQSRVKEKHNIRKQLHKQLAELWKEHPTLNLMNTWVRPQPSPSPRTVNLNDALTRGGQGDYGLTYVETMMRDFERFKFHFVPLVSKRIDLVCSLNILFLRRENPGELLRGQSGDIDNRIKTLFDALKMPENYDQVKAEPEADEKPFFCLLEDDSLVTELSVTTDRLLRPQRPDEHKNEVVLIIQVKVSASQLSYQNLTLI